MNLHHYRRSVFDWVNMMSYEFLMITVTKKNNVFVSNKVYVQHCTNANVQQLRHTHSNTRTHTVTQI